MVKTRTLMCQLSRRLLKLLKKKLKVLKLLLRKNTKNSNVMRRKEKKVNIP